MRFSSKHPVLFPLLFSVFFTFTHAITFEIRNQCPYTVWAAATTGGGQQLNPGQLWTINMSDDTTTGRIWGRTNCNFDASGQGECETGDCGGLLHCQDSGGSTPPNTLVEYSLKQINNLDFYDISLVDGFNIPMDFKPTTGICRGVGCFVAINEDCPNELKAPGGCNNACAAFKTNVYCCDNATCETNKYSDFFRERCPDAFSYSIKNDAPSTFICPSGPNYRVVFCPDSLRLIM
ncbi:hypothetical protein HHK36_000259 [Tetracentron sinense]|uniref:Thaumatin-like protein n=1 Tax=Tetracentron sinense TaxID=13715 RepID=A0A834ZW25_TETSI|nr:hypothetical protein HHK36_000259 [Tetracentron sinense]